MPTRSIFYRLLVVAFIGLFQGVPSAWTALVINEIHYHPAVKTEASQFVELYLSDRAPIDISGWSLTGDIQFTFPTGTVVQPGGYLVVAQNPSLLQQKFKAAALGPFLGRLSARNGTVRLLDATGRIQNEVNYRTGFPWPTVGDPPGYSIELINPALDNTLGGSWRASVAQVAPAEQGVTLIPPRSTWKYFKGLREASDPVNAWRGASFDDSAWETGATPIGYDASEAMGTRLDDMRNNYTSVYFRKTFTVDDPAKIGGLLAEAMYDDGFNIWINGVHVLRQNLAADEMPYDRTAQSALESSAYISFVLPDPSGYLVAGSNLIAIQAYNSSKGSSSDFYIDLKLSTEPAASSSGRGPTPGRVNSVYATNAPPQIRQVEHHPRSPVSGEPVTISAKITDPDGVKKVVLLYQLVDPGAYIELADPAFQTNWTVVPVWEQGNPLPANDVYSVVLPGTLQTHRRLVRYRLVALDTLEAVASVPYADDPQPNFAYFVYDGVPAWRGAIQPKSADAVKGRVVEYDTNVMRQLPVYHLISKKNSVERSTWIEQYGGDLYKWQGTLVYDGEVYDHIRYRARGGVWRYSMGKNMWKLDLNRGHDFQARDNYGQKYNSTWTKINLGACIQQGDYNHRGEQGMFEAVGFKLFNLAGIEACRTHWVQFRIVDDAREADPANQFEGDLWGLYLATEQEDGRFLDEHGLPDGNFYKMEGGNGELNNQGATAATDKSDLNSFMSTFYGNPTDDWWRSNFNLAGYYGYQAIIQGIHHYDIADGKNYFYYLNPATGKWSEHPWDLDLTWADNMYRGGVTGGDEPFKSRVLSRPAFQLEYRNRVRELRDLLFNSDQAWQLIDEYAAIVRDPSGKPSICDYDRAMWDYNPIMISGYVNPGKAGQGRFYQFPNEPGVPKDFTGTVQLMKNYVNYRGGLLDAAIGDPSIPATPQISATSGSNSIPGNRLEFRISAYASPKDAFAAMQWRLAEVAPPGAPVYDPVRPRPYEIDAAWESGDLASFQNTVVVPAQTVKVGLTYRVRARFKDTAGRYGHWSAPVEFAAAEPDNSSALAANLKVTELMYHAPNSEYDFIELHNASTTNLLDLSGARFTQGVEFVFPAGAEIAPDGYLLLVKTTNFSAFRYYYGLASNTPIVGPFSGSLDNARETLVLKSAANGNVILSLTYSDGRGWPAAADGAGHSLVFTTGALSRQGGLNVGANWRSSGFMKGSPGAADPEPVLALVLNEIMANTVYSDPARPELVSNDWIELYNPTDTAIAFDDYYLSDDPADLKKWALPQGVLDAGKWTAFDEVGGFHQNQTNGFGLNREGETMYLSHLPGTDRGRVVDSVRFKAQPLESSWGRYPDGNPYWQMLPPSRGTANLSPGPHPVVQQIMYRPVVAAGSTNDTANLEFIALYNPAPSPVSLSDGNGVWRIDGEAKYDFPTNTVIPARAQLFLVGFDPQSAILLDAFKQHYRLEGQTPAFMGPFSGRLNNASGRVAIERPLLTGETNSTTAWIVVDEVFYADSWPWPAAVTGTEGVLYRTNAFGPASDPGQWTVVSAPVVAREKAPLELTLPTVSADNGLKFQIRSTSSGTVCVERSIDCIEWTPISTNSLEAGVLEFGEKPATETSGRFYRARWLE